MTKAKKIADAAYTAAIEVRYAARDRFLATGAQADLEALNAAVKAQDAAAGAFDAAR